MKKHNDQRRKMTYQLTNKEMTQQQEWEGAENKKKIDIEAIENMGFAPHGDGWEERFDKKFVENKREDGEDYTLYLRDNDIKSFISQEIQKAKEEERERMVKIVEGMEKSPTLCGGCNLNGDLCHRCYANRQVNQALTALTNNLTEK